MRFLSAIALGFAVGGGMCATALGMLPPVPRPDVSPVTSRGEKGELVESFFLDSSGDGIARTHSGSFLLARVPAAVRELSEELSRPSAALLTRLRDARGRVVGLASKLQVRPRDTDRTTGEVVWTTEWTLVLPGRGTLFLHQTERSGPRGIPLARRTGEGSPGDPNVTMTSGPRPDGRGVLVGGTGEFGVARGSFVEIFLVRRNGPDDVSDETFELRVFRTDR